MSKNVDDRLNKVLALGSRLESEERKKLQAIELDKQKRADRKKWVEDNWLKTYRPDMESAIEALNKKLQMAEMPRMRLTQPMVGTSAKVDIEIASELSGRSIRSAVSLTDEYLQFHHYRRVASQTVSVGHNVIGLDTFSIDNVNEVLVDILEAYTGNPPK